MDTPDPSLPEHAAQLPLGPQAPKRAGPLTPSSAHRPSPALERIALRASTARCEGLPRGRRPQHRGAVVSVGLVDDASPRICRGSAKSHDHRRVSRRAACEPTSGAAGARGNVAMEIPHGLALPELSTPVYRGKE